MKLLKISFVFFLSGCYLANGSPSSITYWLKDGKEISHGEVKMCEAKIYSSLGKRFLYLREKDKNNGMLSLQERNEYYAYFIKARQQVSNCFYNLGYRFKAPLYWCLAQDGDNTRICTENMKYRH